MAGNRLHVNSNSAISVNGARADNAKDIFRNGLINKVGFPQSDSFTLSAVATRKQTTKRPTRNTPPKSARLVALLEAYSRLFDHRPTRKGLTVVVSQKGSTLPKS
jgi:hypothetical protein